MKTRVFNKNSWHYSLYKEWADYPQSEISICEYSTVILKCVLVALFGVASVGLATFMLGVMLGEVAAAVVCWYQGLPIFATMSLSGFILLLILFIFSAILILINKGLRKLSDMIYNQRTKADGRKAEGLPDSFFGAAYTSLREKICFKVIFK